MSPERDAGSRARASKTRVNALMGAAHVLTSSMLPECRNEPAQPPARTRSRRPARHRGPDRRRQVRHHVPVAGAADQGMHVVAVADLNVERRASPSSRPPAGRRSNMPQPRSTMRSSAARRTSPPMPQSLIAHPGIEVIVEATGIPEAGIAHAMKTIEHGKHIVMVNVEADARRGSAAGAQGQGRGRRLQPRLGRSAGADLRARRLGARRGLQGGRGGQGHALRAALSPLQSRQRVGHPRQVSEHHRSQLDQPEDVQLASSMAPSPASR